MKMSDILARIDARREELGLSENALSLEAGLSRDAIRNWRRRVEKGDQKAGLTVTALAGISRRLGVSETWLLHGTNLSGTAEQRAASISEAYQNLPDELKSQLDSYLQFLEQRVHEHRAAQARKVVEEDYDVEY
ncbi:helix-turn-helix transcriptional regulator [Thioclava sp. F36-6]|uniref:helix-turn-helix domain-containing protein n=1 Tax=Thioclava sp. F36-6 TaxID=1915316 RepID=UPI001AF0012B|nr:helix-turn-helix transcriptional regulator [Thioclava sp. F36-6]